MNINQYLMCIVFVRKIKLSHQQDQTFFKIITHLKTSRELEKRIEYKGTANGRDTSLCGNRWRNSDV